MQILLTQTEYDDLVRQKNKRTLMEQEKLQDICTLAANHIPVPHECSHDTTPRPWGCILNPRETNPGYCDDCPVDELCPCTHKEWSQ